MRESHRVSSSAQVQWETWRRPDTGIFRGMIRSLAWNILMVLIPPFAERRDFESTAMAQTSEEAQSEGHHWDKRQSTAGKSMQSKQCCKYYHAIPMQYASSYSPFQLTRAAKIPTSLITIVDELSRLLKMNSGASAISGNPTPKSFSTSPLPPSQSSSSTHSATSYIPIGNSRIA